MFFHKILHLSMIPYNFLDQMMSVKMGKEILRNVMAFRVSMQKIPKKHASAIGYFDFDMCINYLLATKVQMMNLEYSHYLSQPMINFGYNNSDNEYSIMHVHIYDI